MTSAPTDARTLLAGLLRQALAQVVPAGTTAGIVLDRPKLAQHGDFACNIALQLAKELRGNPRAIAQQLVAALPASPDLEKAEIAGAGRVPVMDGGTADVETRDTVVLDNTRLRTLTGWAPAMTLEEGLRRSFFELRASREVAS